METIALLVLFVALVALFYLPEVAHDEDHREGVEDADRPLGGRAT